MGLGGFAWHSPLYGLPGTLNHLCRPLSSAALQEILYFNGHNSSWLRQSVELAESKNTVLAFLRWDLCLIMKPRMTLNS